MLKSYQIEELFKRIPSGYLKPDDTFFSSTNRKQFQPFKKLGAISSAQIEEDVTDTVKDASSSIYCNVMNCNLEFDNAAAYKLHYNRMHRFTCQECKKCGFPTEHLLDLHICETHDAYFQARLERGERLYKCYVEECLEVFLNPDERKKHCIEQHKFPANFRFEHIPHKHNGAVLKNLEKEQSDDNPMELDNQDKKCQQSSKEVSFKSFSFGHQERTFQLKGGHHKQDPGKALENLDSLKDALSSM
ncbi:protein lethal(2)k10201 [Stomoxys calcitrans]|uniref:C2H2-type domain-containing protein n=1 Tax=Stomoxys calcitrans TaxID=35570 RepID=A0A1I8PPS3_STOCA|nr:protein lethal(2)k10201 [Stomoxys calcitrans]